MIVAMNVALRPVRPLRGFTLTELLVTVSLVGILASMAVPMVEVEMRRQKEQELRVALRNIRTALDAYKQAVDEGRVERNVEGSGYPPSLDVLAEGVPDQHDPQGGVMRLLRRVPRDPLYPDAAVPAVQNWGLRSYASSHERPRAGKDVFDVYSLDPGIGLNGVPYRQW
jgi:general secretion pathway protein G